MTVNEDAVDLLLELFVTLSCRANDGDLISGPLERGGFHPDAPVERHWQVLYDDEDLAQ
jgi:hypothetical protein